MQSVKVAEIFAEMGLNLDQKSVAKITKQFEGLGKHNASNVQKPMQEATNGVEKTLDLIGKSIKGFLVFAALKKGFDLTVSGIKNMNEELQKSVDFVSNLDNLSADLDLSFQQAQQLNISAMLSGTDESEVKSSFVKFKEKLQQLKAGESNDATNLLQNILGDFIGKENDLQLFGRLISSNKYLDKETADKNIKTVFDSTSGKQKKYLSGAGHDALNNSYDRKDLYITDKKRNQNINAKQALTENSYKKNVQEVNRLDVAENLRTSLNSSELSQTVKELKEELNGGFAKLTEVANKTLNALTKENIWTKTIQTKKPYATRP